MNYLNAGTGYAWAGQVKLIVSAWSFNMIDPFDSWANFGLAPPIGSMKNHLTNLNAGTGKACAGQDKLMLSSELINQVELFEPCGNFGLAPPIGSTQKWLNLRLRLTWMLGQEKLVLDKLNWCFPQKFWIKLSFLIHGKTLDLLLQLVLEILNFQNEVQLTWMLG